MAELLPLTHLDLKRFWTPQILTQLTRASRQLGELKGLVNSMPNPNILINTLSMQEAKESSAIENIVTTHDELFKANRTDDSAMSSAQKEVLAYQEALEQGFELVKEHSLITGKTIREIQATLERNDAGFRKQPGTSLKSNDGRTIYTPPQHSDEIIELMDDLERFINEDELFDVDPLIKMALIHHQFESIHPFYDGNGRTGRIINILYLVKAGLLDIPILYLSQYIIEHKSDYYRLLQEVREKDVWEEWVLYMLSAVEEISKNTISVISHIHKAMLEMKHRLRDEHKFKFYSQQLINYLFKHPYTKIDFLAAELKVSRLTATKYLEAMTQVNILKKEKFKGSSYYLNIRLVEILF